MRISGRWLVGALVGGLLAGAATGGPALAATAATEARAGSGDGATAADARAGDGDGTAAGEVTEPDGTTPGEVTPPIVTPPIVTVPGGGLPGGGGVPEPDPPSVPSPAPIAIEGRAHGVGLPARVVLRPGSGNVLRWTTKLLWTAAPDDAEPVTHVLTPEADASATDTVTLPEPGLYQYTAEALLGDGVTTTERSTYFEATAVPEVSGDVYLSDNPQAGWVGLPGTFTARPNVPGVVAYRYSFDDGAEQRIAATDGVASFTWTPAEVGGHRLHICSEGADGAFAQAGDYYFDVFGPEPRVRSEDYPSWEAAGGAGADGTFVLTPGVAGVVAYRWSLDGGAEQSVAAADDGVATVTAMPDREGTHELTVRSVTAAGEVSEPGVYTFRVASRLAVEPDVYLFDSEPHGGPGVAGTFGFSVLVGGSLVESITWEIDGVAETVPVAAGSFTFTPERSGEHTVKLTAVAPGGLVTDTYEGTFLVAEPES